MAIENLITASGVQEVAERGEETIGQIRAAHSLGSNIQAMAQRTLNRLNAYLDAIKKEEENILSAFGVENEKELQAAFNKFYADSNLISFTGSELDKTILETYRQNLDETLKKRQAYIDKYIIPIVKEKLKEYGEEASEDAIIKTFNKELKNIHVKFDLKAGRVTSSGKAFSFIDGLESFKIAASKLTEAQNFRLQSIMDAAPKGLGLDGSKVTTRATANKTGLTGQIEIDWYNETKGLKASEVKQRWKTRPDLLKKAQENITNLILSKIDGQYVSAARTIIKTMLDIDPYMFFVGGNLSKITGVLGEISAMIAISHLLKNVNANRIAQWVANNKVNKKELSIDIVLKGLAGIQVKNSTMDFGSVPEISFRFAEGGNILSRLKTAYGIDFEDFTDVLESYSFNVPYAMRGSDVGEVSLGFKHQHGATPVDWPIFVEAFKKIISLTGQIQVIMAAYASDLLFMSGGKDFENQLANLESALDEGPTSEFTGNTLYLVNGKPFLMSGMLKTIQQDIIILKELLEDVQNSETTTGYGMIKDELQKKSGFSFSGSLGKETEGTGNYNILTYIRTNISYKNKRTIENRTLKTTAWYGFN